MRFLKALRLHFDWFVYFKSLSSIRKIAENNPGFAYLMELYLRDYRRLHPVDEELCYHTERFYASLAEYNEMRVSEKS